MATKSSAPTDDFFVTAILVTHDGATWLPEIIAALSSQTRPIDRLLAVDTASVDTSAKLVTHAGIPVIKADREIGYGDAIELALHHSPRVDQSDPIGKEWIWLIHDDCAPAKNALSLLIDGVKDRPQVVIAGPKLVSWYDHEHLLEAGVSIASNGSRWTGLEQGEQNQGQHDETREVLAVSTAGMLARRDAFEDLGGLDPNLALFRDDVDLGWRAHVAGYGVICVGAATVFHAQASATERRRVDVSEAFLHRPLLLDRRNAAYVLLANSSWWMLPWVSAQIIGTSLLRASFDLLAKLPGYAADEIVAVGLLLIHPAELFTARRARKAKRLLSPNIIKRFIPPRGSQVRAGVDRVVTTIFRKLRDQQSEELQSQSYANIGTINEEFDEQDLSTPIKSSVIKEVFHRPEFFSLVVITLISFIAGRSRLGSISGGALGLSPGSGMDLLRSYVSSWHQVGMGSAISTPPWAAITGLAAVLSFGHLPLLISAIFLLTPPLAFYIFYSCLRNILKTRIAATVGASVYVLTPVLWGSLNQGRLDTVVFYLLAPCFLFIRPFSADIDVATWRRVFAISLFVGVIVSFSPLLLALWLVAQIMLMVQKFLVARGSLSGKQLFDILESTEFRPILRRLAMLLVPLFITLPWSVALIVHPTHFLVTPGIPVVNGGLTHILLLNSGGVGAPPIWLVAPLALFMISALLIRPVQLQALFASALLSLAVFLNMYHVSGNGAVANVWIGPLLLVISIVIIPAVLLQAEEVIPNLRNSRFGIRHIAVAGVVILTAISATGMIVWICAGSSSSLVKADQPTVVPAFVSALEDTSVRPKTLVINSNSGGTTYYVSRGSEVQLGDADVATLVPLPVQDAISQLVTEGGVSSGKVLGSFGIQYVFVKAPVSTSLARSIDGVGGFTRMSATAAGDVWKVVGAAPRVMYTNSAHQNFLIPASPIGASAVINDAGLITIAEKYDKRWHMLLDGVQVPIEHSQGDLPVFTATHGGHIVILFDGTTHRGLISLQFLSLITVIVMALPWGRRRREVPLEELV
jgi:GT2 family glycosyltransferase